MKLIFCTNQIIGSGGVERVLSKRLNYFVEKFGYDIIVLTTETIDENKTPFFYFNPKIKIYNCKINYSEISLKLKKLSFIKRQFLLRKSQKKNLEVLNQIVNKIQPDILISLGEANRHICYKINYPCKKILEHHVTKEIYTGIINDKGFFSKIKYFYNNYVEHSYIKKYDKFLVLTEEDKKNWENERIKVIKNCLPFNPKEISNCKFKKIISVGRLDEQKGFDILIDVWKEVTKNHSDWLLEIYGEGNLRKELQQKIDSLKLTNSLILKGNKKDIQFKYLESSIYVMSSRYEGMPMVLLEAMSYGLPLVSFDCPCGPKDIIKNGENGFLCKFGNINEMAEKIKYLIENEEERIKMGKKSKELSYDYSEEKIMNQWKELFESLLKNKGDIN